MKLSPSEPVELTILGVYLLCADLGLVVDCEHLVELERLISESQRYGPVLIGDGVRRRPLFGGCKYK